MNLPTTKPNDRDLAWYVRECEWLDDRNRALAAEVDQWAARCAAAIWMLPETVTGGQLRAAQDKFHRERENLRRENAELKKQANDEFDTVITRNMELVRENGRLRMALDASCNAEELRQVRAENAALREERNRLVADFRTQAKQLTQCNRELAQEISQRKIREQLASAQKKATP